MITITILALDGEHTGTNSDEELPQVNSEWLDLAQRIKSAPEDQTHHLRFDRTAGSRKLWITRGLLLQEVDAAAIAGFPEFDEVYQDLKFQLFDENGSPASGSYQGAGSIVDRGRERYAVLGDAYRDATLVEYRISPKPTEESDRNLDDFIAGFRDAMNGRRRSAAKNAKWREGFEEGKRCQKKKSFGWRSLARI